MGANACYVYVLVLVAAAGPAEESPHFSHRTNVSQEGTKQSSPNCLHYCGLNLIRRNSHLCAARGYHSSQFGKTSDYMLNIESTEPAAITMSCLLFKHASEQGFHCLETFTLGYFARSVNSVAFWGG